MQYQLKDIFFQLLRIGLWGQGKLTLLQPMTSNDWDIVRKYAINHTVEGVIYDSFPFLSENQLPPQALRLKWAIRMDQIERHNEKMNQVIAEQFNLFSKHDLNPILVKGQGVAASYQNPLHRTSGDIDWCFGKNEYAIARQLLKREGITFRDTAGFSLDYEWKMIHVEHHKKIFDIRSPLKTKFLKSILSSFKNREQFLTIHGANIRLLAPELQLLQVNAHILKHLLSFGIGLRQLCDSARLYAALSNQVNKKDLENIYKDAGILKWIHLLHKILVEQLGLPPSYLPFTYSNDLNSDKMLDEIWHSGNFGFHDERFKDQKVISAISSLPQGPKRLWLNFKQYFSYAPQEALFCSLVYTYSKFIGKDID